MPYYLVPMGEGRAFALDKAVFFIGRHPECDVVLTHSKKVSRKHCCLAHVNNHFVIRDLGSMNGVRVNGKRVRRMATLHPGDEVAIGDVHYRIQDNKSRVAQQPVMVPQDSDVDLDDGPSSQEIPRPKLPVNLSQDMPVAIPDEDDSFAVEPSSMLETPEQFPKLSLGPDSDSDSEEELLVLEDEEACEDYEQSGSQIDIRPD